MVVGSEFGEGGALVLIFRCITDQTQGVAEGNGDGEF